MALYFECRINKNALHHTGGYYSVAQQTFLMFLIWRRCFLFSCFFAKAAAALASWIFSKMREYIM